MLFRSLGPSRGGSGGGRGGGGGGGGAGRAAGPGLWGPSGGAPAGARSRAPPARGPAAALLSAFVTRHWAVEAAILAPAHAERPPQAGAAERRAPPPRSRLRSAPSLGARPGRPAERRAQRTKPLSPPGWWGACGHTHAVLRAAANCCPSPGLGGPGHSFPTPDIPKTTIGILRPHASTLTASRLLEPDGRS